MSFLFGKARQQKSDPKEALAKLRESIEMLEKREKYLEAKIVVELKNAKANATKNKRGIRLLYSCNNVFKAQKGIRRAN
jgi:charged multivesicular body protein 4